MHYIQHEVLTIKFEVNSIKVETLCADPRGSVGVLIACLGWPLPSFLFYFYSSSSSLVHHGLLMVRPSAPSFIIIGLAHFFFLRFARASCRTNANRNEKRDADDDGGPRGNISKGAFWLHSFTPDAFIGHFLFFFRMRPMNRKIPFNFNTTESHRGDLSQKNPRPFDCNSIFWESISLNFWRYFNWTLMVSSNRSRWMAGDAKSRCRAGCFVIFQVTVIRSQSPPEKMLNLGVSHGLAGDFVSRTILFFSNGIFMLSHLFSFFKWVTFTFSIAESLTLGVLDGASVTIFLGIRVVFLELGNVC